ncbi:hypothetical protein G9A89_007780 [Geosiphon pyriformis]|nr:hypothetical protein G9A89_007780 [Geosiphon pyriformis]
MEASRDRHIIQAGFVNSFIVRTCNESIFVILGGNFNEVGNKYSSSFSKCVDLGLVNTLVNSPYNFGGHLLVNALTWGNSRGAMKVIDYIFVSGCLLLAVAGYKTGEKQMDILKHLSLVKSEYRKSKMYKSKLAEEMSIRNAIKKHIERFYLDKSDIIKSVLDCLFHKVVLDHLVIDNGLILEPEKVNQYAPLGYVRNNAFSGVIYVIDMSELVLVIGSLPDGKVAGLLDIPNELWKHGGKEVLKCLLVLLNAYLIVGRIESGGEMTSYFAAGAFVDDTIWYALNMASVITASLSICEQLISIAKKSEAHCYLSIFLSTKELSKPSVTKTYSDVCFFANVLLKKTVTDKQFLYLVSAVLQPIVAYWTQFNVMIRKGIKSKVDLPRDFPSEALHHPSLYGLKSFEQVQTKSKLAAVISFSNDHEILGLLGWVPLDPLQFSVRLCISPVNNFLAGVVRIFLDNKLFLSSVLPGAFCDPGVFPMSLVLEKSVFFDSVCSLKHFGVAFSNQLYDKKGRVMDWKTFCCWKRFNSKGPVLYWFMITSKFLNNKRSLESVMMSSLLPLPGSCISDSKEFIDIWDSLYEVWSGGFEIYTDGSLKNAGSAGVMCGATAYFLALDMGIGVKVRGLLFSIMAELQAIVLALECVLSSCSLNVYLDSQAAIDACVSEMFKSHSGVADNVKADTLAGKAVDSLVFLPVGVQKHFLMAEGLAVSGNTHHFVRNVFRSVCRACWEAGPGHSIISRVLVGDVNWVSTSRVWHPNLHMLTGFTSRKSAALHAYIMKAVHHRLPIAVHKRLYDKKYLGVLCLLCSEVELPDYAFSCAQDVDIWKVVLFKTSAFWAFSVGTYCLPLSAVSQVLDLCHSDVGLYSMICKGLVLREWCKEAMEVFDEKKRAVNFVVNLVGRLVKSHHSKVWLLRSEFRVHMKKAGLVGDDGVLSGLLCCADFVLSDSMVRFLGVLEFFAVSFGYHRSCLFFSGLNSSPHVNIGV